jgi:hypothetical protein
VTSDNAHQLPADIETLHALVAAARAGYLQAWKA